MSYSLPNKLPELLLVGDKTFKLLTPKESVRRGVCKSNSDGWFYYFNQKVLDGGEKEIGSRRHFSVQQAKNRRSVHISMKPSAAKNDTIMIWYRYDAQWTGQRTEPEGWGRIDPRPGQNATRVEKAARLLKTFLEAMDAVAKGGSAVPVKPCLTPPIVSLSSTWNDWGVTTETDNFFPPPIATPVTPKTTAELLGKAESDDWEDYV